MFKRIISLITLLTFLVPTLSISAYDTTDIEYYLNETFDLFADNWYVIGERVSLSTVPGSSGGDKSLKMESYKDGETATCIPVEHFGKVFTIDFNFRSEMLTNEKSIGFADATGARVEIFTALSGGVFGLINSSKDFKKAGVYKEGKWNNIALAVDIERNSISCFANGKYCGTSDIALSQFELTQLVFSISAENGKSDVVFIDDLRAYSGTVPLKEYFVRNDSNYSTVALAPPESIASSFDEAYKDIDMFAFFNFNSDKDEAKGPAKWISEYNNASIGCVEDSKAYGRSVKLTSPGPSRSPILALDTADIAYYDISSEKVGDFVIDFDVKFSDITSLRFFGFYTNNASQMIQLWRTTNTGTIALLSKVNKWTSEKFEPNKWYNTQAVIKVKDGKYTTYDIYFDGKLIGEDLELNGTPFTRLNKVRINQGAIDSETYMFVDNFKIYAGSKPVEIDLSLYEVEEESEEENKNTVTEPLFETCFASDEDLKEYFKDYILIHKGYPNAIVYGEKKPIDAGNENVSPFVENGRTYVPVRFLSEAMGAFVSYDASAKSTVLNFDGIKLCFTVDSCEYTVNGKTQYIDSPVVLRENRIFVPIRAITESIDKNIKLLSSGSVIIGPYKDKFKGINEALKHTTVLEQAERLLYYNRPSGNKIYEDYNKMGGVHPSINATEADFFRITEFAKTDKFVKTQYDKFITSADKLLETPVPEYAISGSGGTILTISRQTITRAETLGLAFLTTKEDKFKKRLWKEIEAVCAFENWSPENILANSEMAYAISVAYDWLYHYWTDEQKQMMENAIMEKSIAYYLNQYRNDLSTSWFAYSVDNQAACTNSCFFIAALTFMQAFPKECMELAEYAIQSIEYALGAYAPDGGYAEGPGYWDYGTKYLTYFMQTAENVLGTDYEYFENAPGFSQTSYFITNMTGTTATFNWSDASEMFVDCASLMYMAKRNKDAALMDWRVQNVMRGESSVIIQDIIWYDPSMTANSSSMPLDGYFTEVMSGSFRSAWNDPSGNYIGFHGGTNRANHGHLDMGSFVIDAAGVRWAKELGMESYVTGYFDFEYWRWTFYRARAEGQNTISLNPIDDPDQNPLADKAVMENFVSKPKGGFAVLDTTNAYNENALKARRGFMLSENRKVFTVQDEVILSEKGELYWFMHTTQKIEIADNGRSAVLKSDDKSLYVKIISDNPELKFSVMDAVSLPSSYNNELQNKNKGIRKLVIYAKGTKEFNAAVVMSTDKKAFDNVNAYTKLDSWSVPDGELIEPIIKTMKINGVEYDEFRGNQKEYNIYFPAGKRDVPNVEVTSDYPYIIEQAKTMADKTYIKVYEKNNPDNYVVYTVSYWENAVVGKPTECPQHKIVSYEASNITTQQPSNAFDKDLSTYWTSPGPATMTMDLGEVKDVSALVVRWLSGNKLRFYYKVETSLDGLKWNNVFNGISTGEADDFETSAFATHKARYVRITSFKNNTSIHISHTELEVY